MTAAEIRIDLMPLADLGHPRKLAYEVHRQLREQLGKVPSRVPLAAIASAVGIVEIVDHNTQAFEGTLLVDGERGAIALRKGLGPGRRNFTLGHELGHFLNPWHRTKSQRFECSKIDLNASRSNDFDQRTIPQRMEIEANEFSAALLIPAPEFREERKRLGSDIDVAHLRELATSFDVSLEFMSKTFVDTSRDKIAVIISHLGKIQRVIPHKDFPYLGLRRGRELPRASMTLEYCRKNPAGSISRLSEIGTDVWLERRGAVTGLYEQVLVQRQGWATTLLVIDEEEEDDEGDDRNWNRRSRRWS